jgi:hypothetical protein
MYKLLLTVSHVSKLRTLSRITNGPLTPPMVLYRILGVTEIMRGSTTSGIVAVVSGSGRCSIARSEIEGRGRSVASEIVG